MSTNTHPTTEASQSPEVNLRAYTGQDETALLELWNQTLIRDPITCPMFHTKVILDYNFQPENLLLAFINGKLCGFVLSVYRRVPMLWEGIDEQTAWITAFGVCKEACQRGISTALFETVEQRFREKSFTRLQISPYTPNYFTPGIDCEAYPDAVRFIQNRGYRVIDQPVSMQIDLLNFSTHEKVHQIQHNLKEEHGIHVREVRGEDLPELMQLIAEHFGAEWLRHARQYLLEKMHNSSQEIGYFVAVQGSKVVGYCQFKSERFGPYGVIPEMRNLGLGAVLLNHCLEAMKACGYRVAWFLWAEAQVARLYERTGFKPVRRFFILQKSLVE